MKILNLIQIKFNFNGVTNEAKKILLERKNAKEANRIEEILNKHSLLLIGDKVIGRDRDFKKFLEHLKSVLTASKSFRVFEGGRLGFFERDFGSFNG